MKKIKKTPLSGTFMVISLIVFIMSLFFTVFGRIPMSYGFLLVFMSTIFVVAAMGSIMPTSEELD